MSHKQSQSIEAQEIADLSTMNGLSNLHADIALVRARVSGGLLPADPQATGEAWAVYEYQAPDNEIELDGDYGRRQVAIIAEFNGDQRVGHPRIRMIRREPSRYQALGYLVTDLTIFTDRDAQYFFGFDPAEKIPMSGMPNLAPAFRIGAAGILELTNCQPATSFFTFGHKLEESAGLVTPLGVYYNRVDRVFAAKEAVSITKHLKDVEPIASGQQINQSD